MDFGAKMHVGADAGSGLFHTVKVTSANVHDASVAHKLLWEDDEVMYGDAANCSVENHPEVKNDEHLSQIEYCTNNQKLYRKMPWPRVRAPAGCGIWDTKSPVSAARSSLLST